MQTGKEKEVCPLKKKVLRTVIIILIVQMRHFFKGLGLKCPPAHPKKKQSFSDYCTWPQYGVALFSSLLYHGSRINTS